MSQIEVVNKEADIIKMELTDFLEEDDIIGTTTTSKYHIFLYFQNIAYEFKILWFQFYNKSLFVC